MMFDPIAFASFAAFATRRQREYSTSFEAASTKLHEAALEAACFVMRVQRVAFVHGRSQVLEPRPLGIGGP